jgi:hypothetical protein
MDREVSFSFTSFLVSRSNMKQAITATAPLYDYQISINDLLIIGFVTSLRDFLSSWFFGLFDQRSLSALRLQEPSF